MILLFKLYVSISVMFFTSSDFESSENVYNASIADPEGCTTALIAGWAAPDGRPLLWKCRDVSLWEQEFHYHDETPYSFIGITYVNEETQVWGGVNEVGFAIENANAWNFDDSSGVPDDDGVIQYHALQTCATVEEFLAYMDTTARIGRTRPSIYGVFDAFGGAGMLEASLYENFWFDANDTSLAPEGIMVRANFAYAGGPNHVGQYRHDRALELIEPAVADSSISVNFLFDIVSRDLTTEYLDPYPLPYQGYYIYNGDTLNFSIRDHDAINREITQSNYIVQGIIPGENPLTSTLWVQVGEPIMTPYMPLWVAAGSVPLEVDGENGSSICLRARELFNYLYYPYPDPYDDIINTNKILDVSGYGVLSEVRRVEQGYYDFVQAKVENWRSSFPPAEEIEALQDSIAELVYNELTEPFPVDDLAVNYEADSLRLSWPPVVRTLFSDTISTARYSIYSGETAEPYSGIEILLGVTSDTTFAIEINSGENSGFYQVRAVYP